MKNSYIRLPLTEELLQKSLKYFFALITIHVLVIYFLKNIGNFGINDPSFIVIKMWKELFLSFVLVLFFLINKNNSVKINIVDSLIIIFILVGILYTLISPRILTAVWSFRSIYEVFGFYLLGRCLSIKNQELFNFFRVLVLMGCLTSLFAVFQVQFLGSDFFKEVYGVEEIATAMTSYGYSNIRASSTFITPHEFGLFIVLCFLFASYLYKCSKISRNIFLLINIILLVGLAFSLSRSSILIVIICYGLYWVNSFKNALFFIVLCLVGAGVMYLIGLAENFSSVIEGKDPSSMGRFVVLKEFKNFVIDHPLGAGLGTVGVVVRRFIPNAPQFEGEIFNIFAMTSVFGGTLYVVVLMSVFYKNWIKANKTYIPKHYSYLYKMVAILVIAITLRELILPRDFTNYALAWFLIGTSISIKFERTNLRQLKLKYQIHA